MTCHDGVVAIDAHGTKTAPRAVISKNLDRAHPIGFSYDEAMASRGPSEVADNNLRFATAITISTVPGQHTPLQRNGFYRIKEVLYNGSIMICASCHDVHNKNNVTPDAGHTYNYLLWAKEEGSLLCLSCHIK